MLVLLFLHTSFNDSFRLRGASIMRERLTVTHWVYWQHDIVPILLLNVCRVGCLTYVFVGESGFCGVMLVYGGD